MNDGTNGTPDPNDLFTKMWSEFAAKMASAGVTFSPEAPPPEASRQVRDAMLDAMGKYCDQYMRSPQFLEGMKQSLDTAVGFRKQLNDFLTRSWHDMQMTAREDIDELVLAVHKLHRQLGDRMDELSSRVEELNARLDGTRRRKAPRPASGAAAAPSRSAARNKPGPAKRTKTKRRK